MKQANTPSFGTHHGATTLMQRATRLVRHRLLDENDSRSTVPPDMVARLQKRVAASEKRHSGEVRICVEAGLPLSYLWRKQGTHTITRQRAVDLFGKLGVWDTAHNNGVLIYLLLAEKSIEIVADRGLNEHVSAEEWQAVIERMRGAFKTNRFEDGLTDALAEVSALLVKHFAAIAQAPNPNELPDSPVLM